MFASLAAGSASIKELAQTPEPGVVDILDDRCYCLGRPEITFHWLKHEWLRRKAE
jgi:hypothetical protein